MSEEAAFTVTLKSGTDFDSSWLVVRGNTAIEIQAQLEAVIRNGIGAVIGNASRTFHAEHAAGSQLGAEPVQAPQNAAIAPQNAQIPQSEDPWQTSPQAAAQGYQQVQQQAPVQQGPQAQAGYVQPQQAGFAQQPTWNGGGQPAAPNAYQQQPQNEAWKSDPSIQPAHVQVPQNQITGQPMKYKGGYSKSNNRPYRMFVDERPWGQIKDLPDNMKAQSVFLRDADLGL